jgi:glutaminyl-peptide cyclotransferase
MKTLRFYSVELALVAILGGAVVYFGYLLYGLLGPSYSLEPFSGERARYYLGQQLSFGARVPGSEASVQTRDWLAADLSERFWDVIIQPYAVSDAVTANNVIAQKGDGPEAGPVVILSTHYDSRVASDRDADEEKRSIPTPGANAGASGTALLLELARVLDVEKSNVTVCLVFFDGEDNGGLPGWEYSLGSETFMQHLATDTPRCSSPTVAVYVDLIGGMDANIAGVSPESPAIVDALRETAHKLGYGEQFRGPQVRDEIDALTRFTEAGIPAVMLADLGYDYRHTTSDTLDKTEASALQQLGDILKSWIEAGAKF